MDLRINDRIVLQPGKFYAIVAPRDDTGWSQRQPHISKIYIRSYLWQLFPAGKWFQPGLNKF